MVMRPLAKLLCALATGPSNGPLSIVLLAVVCHLSSSVPLPAGGPAGRRARGPVRLRPCRATPCCYYYDARCVKILDVAAQSDTHSSQQRQVHHVATATYLPLHHHLLAARDAAVRRTVRPLQQC